MTKRNILLIGIGILIILTSLLGISYALWVFTDSQSDENVVNLDCFEIKFSEDTGSIIQMKNAFPLRDNDGEALKPYHFEIENKCSSYAKYTLTIETNQNSTLDTKYLKVKTNENTPVIMSALSPGEVKNEANQEAYVIDTGYLDKLESKKYDVRIWLDEKVTTDDMNSNGSTVENSSWNGFVNLSVAYSNKKGAILAGMEVPLVEEGTGLYEVEHTGVEITDENGEIVPGWDTKELRYAGVDPDNYVDFNGEKWRIIGLVNVLTTDGNVEQRLKIIKAEIDEEYKDIEWNSITTENNWATASLQTTLNGTYLDNMLNKDMIATDISWNLGGCSSLSGVTTSEFYQYERGTAVYEENPTAWPGQIALMYPSDYGYATIGGNTYNRSQCLTKDLYNWNTESYQTDCAGNNWLYDSSNIQWTLMPESGGDYEYYIDLLGSITCTRLLARIPKSTRPVVYLKPKVKIISDENANGSQEHPFTLSME